MTDLSPTLDPLMTTILCISAAFILQRIYYVEKSRAVDKGRVLGIKWFSLSIFLWGLGALVSLLFMLLWPAENSWFLPVWSLLISVLNSFFILLSLPYIEHDHQRNRIVLLVQNNGVRGSLSIFVGVFLMLGFVYTLSVLGTGGSFDSSLLWLMDLPLSFLVAIALLQELNKAFMSRQMPFMRFPALLLFVLILVGVTHRLIPETLIQSYVSASLWTLIGLVSAVCFKFLFILLFSILLYSWRLMAEKEEQGNQNRQYSLRIEGLEGSIANLRNKERDWDRKREVMDSLIEEQRQRIVVLEKMTAVQLSGRQREVLEVLGLYGQDSSYTELAERLNISVDGFQAHIYQIKKILNIKGSDGKEQLIDYARSQGFTSDTEHV